MEWFIVLSLLGLGLLLIVVEVIFIPGTTIAGFVGFGLLLFGLFMTFRYFDEQTGWAVFGGTALFSLIVFIWIFTTKPWKQFSLKTASKSKVNEGAQDGLEVGQEGVAISALRPRGNAEIGAKTMEVVTLGDYVQSGTRVKIIKISLNQILVEPIN
jgi:membrane-bound ClpP family serine protease